MVIRILFVDSDVGLLRQIQQQVQPLQRAWDCQFATNMEDALKILDSQLYDVLVTDHLMARSDGTKLLTMVMNKHPQVVRFVFADAKNQTELMRLGHLAHQYMPKFAALPVLRDAIEHAIALRYILTGEELQQIISRIRKLPGLPMVYLEILKEMRNKEASLKRIGELITRDAGLSAQVLKLVNSAYYSLRSRVSSPIHAVSLLGLESIQSLVLAADIFEQFDRLTTLVPNFSMKEFQQHCLQVSGYVGLIARAEGWENTKCNDAAMTGLLHDIGQLVLAENFPRQYIEVLQTARTERIDIWIAERAAFGTTHAEVGAYLLGLWGISGSIVEACAFHHQPQYGRQRGVSQTSILHVANAFAGEANLDALDAVKGRIDRQFLRDEQVEQKLPAWRAACPAISDKKPVSPPMARPAQRADPAPKTAASPAPPTTTNAGLWEKIREWFGL